jgi:hypothetical protein
MGKFWELLHVATVLTENVPLISSCMSHRIRDMHIEDLALPRCYSVHGVLTDV